MWRKGCQILVKCGLRPMHSAGHVHEALLQCYFFHSFSLGHLGTIGLVNGVKVNGVKVASGGIWVSEVQQGSMPIYQYMPIHMISLSYLSFYVILNYVSQHRSIQLHRLHRLHRTLLLGIFVSYAECIRVFFLRQWNVASAWIHGTPTPVVPCCSINFCGTSTHHLGHSSGPTYHVIHVLSRAIGRLRNSFGLQSFAPSALLSPQHVDSAGNRQTELSKITFCRRLKWLKTSSRKPHD